MRISDFVQWTTRAGKPVTVNQVTITPLAQAFIIRWPQGGLVWNRPVALFIEQHGQTRRLSILDVTRMMQMILLGIGGLVALFFWVRTYKETTR